VKRALLICTGNTCRSSMAEELARQAAKSRGLTGWAFSSAGLWAMEGSPASANACKVLSEWGLDLRGHRAKQLKQDMLEEVDLILTMTTSHRAQLLDKYPQVRDKLFTLLDFAHGLKEDVYDPFGGDEAVYRETAEQIRLALDRVTFRLLEQNTK